jgi:hypothetical protein
MADAARLAETDAQIAVIRENLIELTRTSRRKIWRC